MNRILTAVFTAAMCVLSYVSFRAFAVTGEDLWLFIAVCGAFGVLGGIVGFIEGTAFGAWITRTFIGEDDE